MYKLFKDFLLEGRDAYLYHATNINNLKDILLQNTIKDYTSQIIDGKEYNGVSLTRNYRFAYRWEIPEDSVIFVLDQRKLTYDYKIVPYSVIKLKLRKSFEYEEFLLGKINNLSKYLVSINIPKVSILFKKSDYDIIKKYKHIINVYIPQNYKKYYYSNKEVLKILEGKG